MFSLCNINILSVLENLHHHVDLVYTTKQVALRNYSIKYIHLTVDGGLIGLPGKPGRPGGLGAGPGIPGFEGIRSYSTWLILM